MVLQTIAFVHSATETFISSYKTSLIKFPAVSILYVSFPSETFPFPLTKSVAVVYHSAVISSPLEFIKLYLLFLLLSITTAYPSLTPDIQSYQGVNSFSSKSTIWNLIFESSVGELTSLVIIIDFSSENTLGGRKYQLERIGIPSHLATL